MKKYLFLIAFLTFLLQTYSQTKPKSVINKTAVSAKKNVKPVLNTPTLTLKEQQIKHLTESISMFLKFQFMSIDYNLMLYKKPILEFLNHTDTSVIVLQQDYLKHTKYQIIGIIRFFKNKKNRHV